MINFLKNALSTKNDNTTETITETKTINESIGDNKIIQEIHNEFDTAPDRLLKQALEILQKESSTKIQLESDIENKANRLAKIGFVKNEAVIKKKEIDDYNKTKDLIIELTNKEALGIKYYSEKYPFLKFLTESELDRICDKYGLVYAPVNHYKNDVPEKNLQEIENAQPLDKVDAINEIIYWEFNMPYHKPDSKKELYNNLVKQLGKNIFTQEELTIILTNAGLPSNHEYQFLNAFWDLAEHSFVCDGTKHTENRKGYFIAAPKEHFDLTGLTTNKENKGFFQRTSVTYKDPIVFRYVLGGIQVITKWGLEAEDETLQVPILN